jgi:hypothetical protein
VALFQPDFSDPGEDRATSESVGAADLEPRLVREGRQVIAEGSLVCPECDLPLPGRPAMSATALVFCGWCGHAARVRELFRPDVLDAPANAVALVAWLRS